MWPPPAEFFPSFQASAPNFTLLDSSLPEIGRLISAMLQARDAVGRRSWSHPQEPTGENGGPTCLRTRALASESGAPISPSSERSIGLPMKSARSYLSRAASAIGVLRLRATTSSPRMVRTTPCPTYSTISPHRVAAGSALNGIAAGYTTSNRLRAWGKDLERPLSKRVGTRSFCRDTWP
jgi:hypothetical protein